VLPRLGCFLSKYFLTVRGETRIPSLSFSSSTIRSSPQVGLSCAIPRISSRRFCGSRGRPRFLDFHLQNIRNAVRCYLRNVLGLTMTKALRQSKNLDSKTMMARVAAVERRGLTLRSLNRASCLRRNRFSAVTAAWEERNNRMNVNNSTFYKRSQAFQRRSNLIIAEHKCRGSTHAAACHHPTGA
jgi:hypothetical protein